jgi:voltage-gated potassium channel
MSEAEAQPASAVLRVLRETTVVLLLLTLAYFLLPVGDHRAGPFLGKAVVALVPLALVAWLFAWQVRHSQQVLAPSLVRIQWLLSALYLIVLGFALAYAVLARISPDQMTGVDGRVAALYFSATVVSTVGLGDVHPAGHAGPLLATTQMMFDLIYIGAALRMLAGMRAGGPPDIR